jgi:succinyl-diaminopimelate desuccinylase
MEESARIRARIEGMRDRMVALQRDLTAAPALGPQNGGQGEWDKAQVLLRWIRDLGFPEPSVFSSPDPRVPSGLRPNILLDPVGSGKGRPEGGALWIMTHMDIVPPGEARLWSGDPYRMREDGERLIGRGVEDNQQSMVASLSAAAALRELGRKPARPVRLLFVSDEETGSEHGIQYLLRTRDLFAPGDHALVPDSGSTDGTEVEIAEKSILWLRVATRGRQCHASTPGKGANAFVAASRLVVDIHGLNARFSGTDPLFDPPVTTISPTRKEANVPNINTIPGDDAFYVDCRLLPSLPPEDVLRSIGELARKTEKEYGVTVGIETVQANSSPPTRAEAPIVIRLMEAIRKVYGVSARTIGIGGGTVGAFLRQKGIDTAVWSRIQETAHMPDESCLVTNMIGDACVMAALML